MLIRPNSEKRQQFVRRAEAFAHALEDKKSHQSIQRYGRTLRIGRGKHANLITDKTQLELLGWVFDRLEEHYNEHGPAKEFILKEPLAAMVERRHPVQEYFAGLPTLDHLMQYLKESNEQGHSTIPADRQTEIQGFLQQEKNQSLTYEKLKSAEQELYEHTTSLSRFGRRTIISPRNIIVLGVKKSKVILAPVDLE